MLIASIRENDHGLVSWSRTHIIEYVADHLTVANTHVSWNGWIAVFAPAKTPIEVQAKLSSTMELALRKPDVRKKLEEQDMLVAWASPSELLQMEKDTLEAMRSLRNLANLKPED